jgi:hypothetical protein
VRTLIVLLIGLALSVGMVYAGKALGRGTVNGALLFIGLWMIFTVIDYYAGVNSGYSALEELGIHLVVFIVPAVGAWLAARWLA